MVRHPPTGPKTSLTHGDHSLTLTEVVKSGFQKSFINFTYMGCERDWLVVADLFSGFSLLGDGGDDGVFPPVWNHPLFPAAPKEGQQRLHIGFRQLPRVVVRRTIYTRA